jgi:bifunctional DNA-binding transcriptional regulator/antitoxin component of YhaV-PrlF toxin-antitoxin module
MQQIVSITSRGQMTIPQEMLRQMSLDVPLKVLVRQEKNMMIVEPKRDFWSLAGSLESKVVLTDNQLRKARNSFSKKWAKK